MRVNCKVDDVAPAAFFDRVIEHDRGNQRHHVRHVDTAQQPNATQDISRSVQIAARGTLDVSNHIVQITSTSSETGRMAGDARDSAVDLLQQAETLKREVDGFIMSVRTG